MNLMNCCSVLCSFAIFLSAEGDRGQLQDSGRKGLEEIITLAKVMELVAKPRDLHVSEASKMTELKELVKLLQANVDASLTKLTKN